MSSSRLFALVLSVCAVCAGAACAQAADQGGGTCTTCAADSGGSHDDTSGHDDVGEPIDVRSDTGGGGDTSSASDTGSSSDSAGGSDTGSGSDTSSGSDTASGDTASGDTGIKDTGVLDTGVKDTGTDTGSGGVITGGPCSSGATGATAFRLHFSGSTGSTATPVYDLNGLPDKSRWHIGVFGYSIGFTSSYVDTFLEKGGLQLDGSDFIDVELSTKGVSGIRSATLAIRGRSYDTTTSGGFNWQTFTGTGATASDLVWNSTPYRWYTADATSAIASGDSGMLLRIKAGGLSGSLVVNAVELCVDAS